MAYSQKSINNYRARKYYTFSVSVPSEHREEIKAAAAARGVSVSRLVCDLLGQELGLDLALDGEFKGGSQAGASRKDQPAAHAGQTGQD